MTITRTVSYSGTVEALPMLLGMSIAKEYETVISGNTRQQVETGGLIIAATFNVDGSEVTVEKVVTAAQVSQLTLQQVLAAAATLLEAELGL